MCGGCIAIVTCINRSALCANFLGNRGIITGAVGGLLGAFYIVINIFSVNRIGIASTFMAVVIGQIVAGALIDHFGLFGGATYPLNHTKLIALALMFVGIYLFNKA